MAMSKPPLGKDNSTDFDQTVSFLVHTCSENTSGNTIFRVNTLFKPGKYTLPLVSQCRWDGGKGARSTLFRLQTKECRPGSDCSFRLQEQSDLGMHCLLRPICSNI